MKFFVELAQGCYTSPTSPIISRHRTIEGAIRAARKSDRLVVATETGVVVYRPPQRNGRLGVGRYGEGPRKGEPTIRESVAAAKAILAKGGTQ